jgi:hypothetical protein
MELSEIIKNVTIDKSVIEERKKYPPKPKSEVSFDLDVDTFNQLKDLSGFEDIPLEEYLEEFIHQVVLQSFEKPEGVVKVIDEIMFHTNCDQILESGQNYLLVDSQNLDKRAVLVTEPSMVSTIMEQNKK